MENRSQYDDLLTKYLLNELSPGEEENISKWIDSDAENGAYFERFKATWNLSAAARSINTIDVDQEWSYHKRVISGADLGVAQEGIREKTEKPNRHKIYRILAASAIAASILLVAGLGVFFFETRKTDLAEQIPGEKKVAANPVAILPLIQTEINPSGSPRKLVLDDGSEIVLYARSEVSYEKSFVGGTREIKLKGKADFKVHADKARPFVVHSSSISTTALGTEFTVTDFERDVVKSVKLYEGRVVIRSADSALRKLEKDFYLLPGQEFIYNNNNATAVVRNFKSASTARRSDKARGSDNLSLPENYKGSWFMFNNQSLPEVFDQLQGMFNVEIEYEGKDLERMYFIGKFDKADSLENILNKMAILYHLKLTKQNKKFLISK